MSRDKRYQRLLNSRRWWEVKRLVWQRAGAMCEECAKQGRDEAGVDCHHIIPVESAKYVADMERLCSDVNNIQLLCVACHVKVHTQAKSHSRKQHQERAQLEAQRWLENIAPVTNQTRNDDHNQQGLEVAHVDPDHH